MSRRTALVDTALTAEGRRFALVLRTVAAALEQALATNEGVPLPDDVAAAAAVLTLYAFRATGVLESAHPRAPAPGAVASTERVVAIEDTAAAMGHPDASMTVLGSPQIALWFEVSTSDLMPDPDRDLSHVGVGILVHHVARAVVGETVKLTATVAAVAGRTVVFTCEARVGERLVALGVHQRVILDNPAS